MRTLGFQRFVEQLGSLLRVEIPSPANPYDDLYEDLGFDSFKAFEMLIIIESLAECMVPPLEVPEIYTLADAHVYYEQLRTIELAGS